MNKSILYILLGVSLFFTSCIPVKDLVYLQYKNGTNGEAPISEVMLKPYRLQVNDVLKDHHQGRRPQTDSHIQSHQQRGDGQRGFFLVFFRLYG